MGNHTTPEKKDRKRRSSRSSGSQSSLSSEEGNFEPSDIKAKRPVGGVAVLPMADLKKATQKRAEKMAAAEEEKAKADHAEGDDGEKPHVVATTVTTIKSQSHEDERTNQRTQQVEEKTFTAKTLTTGNVEEQIVTTQETKKQLRSLPQQEQDNSRINQQDGLVATEAQVFDAAAVDTSAISVGSPPLVETESRKVVHWGWMIMMTRVQRSSVPRPSR